MQEAAEAAEEVEKLQAQQRSSLAEGAHRMDLARERMRKASRELKRPRDRHLCKGRALAGLREMSKDFQVLERGLERMRERDGRVSDLLDNRRDLLLRACFELKKTVDAGQMFRDVERARSVAEPLGGRRLDTALPDWVPGRN